MEFEKALPREAAEIFGMYREAIGRMQAAGIDQWDDVYPTRAVVEQDIANGEMRVGLLDGAIVCAFVLNREQWAGYENGDWQYPGLPFAVLHRLCIRSACQGKGLGVQVMQYVEALLKSEGVAVLQLDAFPQNQSAMKLYEKLGYIKVGDAPFRKGRFCLFEKKL